MLTVRHGLRHVSVGPRGLRLNGRPLHLSGQEVQSLAKSEALALRQRDHNLLLAPVSEASQYIWDTADEMGFFVLGKLGHGDNSTLTSSLAKHPSCLGWLVPGSEIPAGVASAPLLGCLSGTVAPADANFVAVPFAEASSVDAGLPVLLLGASAVGGASRATPEGDQPLLGVIAN
jgi:hypothetical protein